MIIESYSQGRKMTLLRSEMIIQVFQKWHRNKKLEKNDIFTIFRIYTHRPQGVVDIISNSLVLVLFFVVGGLSEL